MKYFCTIVLFSLVLVYAVATKIPQCVSCCKNEIYHECQPCAAINCGDKSPEICPTKCHNPGCYCQPGYLRKYGICIPQKLCDKCGPYEYYRDCEPCSPVNCGDPTVQICPFICKNSGCYCIPGFLRKNGTCVPEKLCSGCIE